MGSAAHHAGFSSDLEHSEADLAPFRWMYKHLREIGRRMPFYRGEVLGFHPTFPEGSDATCKVNNMPVAFDTPNIVYTAEDDAAIDDYHRRTSKLTCFIVKLVLTSNILVRTAWHAVSIFFLGLDG